MYTENEGVLVEYDGEEVGATVVKFEKEIELQDMYKLIGCNLVELIKLPNNIDIWIDEEGTFISNNPIIQYKIEDDHVITLVGKALFLSTNEDGDTIPLSKDQLYWIHKNVKIGFAGYTE